MKLTARSSLRTVATVVGDALRRAGIHAVLTGGACAHIYTRGGYQSSDADFIVTGAATRGDLDRVLRGVGFSRAGDRYVHRVSRFFVEFPRGPLAIGGDLRIRPVRLRASSRIALALSATDSCRDRLAAFYHWGDRQSLRVAVQIAGKHRVSIAKIRRWSIDEGARDGFDRFSRELERLRSSRGRAAAR